ncbi:ABC transporter substrate-binding protein [Microlunatus speluncae]|uniref:ABC transporter substrate-binding protein n=1 Tax=Microlunatus speluncae TaxID=2594267 RepID=UPI0012661F9A|nr:ABC transporter substrate-binding protein [Microlunatus speluncae]
MTNELGRRLGAATLALLVMVVALTSCQSQPVSDPASADQPRTVTDPTGRQVEIPGSPQRVFGVYSTDVDYAMTLGLGLAPVQSIASSAVGFPAFFPQAGLAGIEPMKNYPEIQYEKVAAIQPDVIINGLGYEGGADHDKLAAIAPTFTYDGFDGDWRDDFTALAAAFGRQQEADTFLRQVADRTAEVKSRVAALDRPPVFAYGVITDDGGGGFNGSAPTKLNPQLFEEVGISSPSAVGKDWTTLAPERIADLDDVDLIMIAVSPQRDAKAELGKIRNNPVWSGLPAVRSGRLMAVDNELNFASPHAALTFLDVIDQGIDRLDPGE